MITRREEQTPQHTTYIWDHPGGRPESRRDETRVTYETRQDAERTVCTRKEKWNEKRNLCQQKSGTKEQPVEKASVLLVSLPKFT